MIRLAKRTNNQNKQPSKHDTQKLPFMEHAYELRPRLFYIAISIVVFSLFAYSINQRLVSLLLKPADVQKFTYASPVGGVDFLFRVCLYFGIAISIPVIVYQLLRYLEPLFKVGSGKLITRGSIASGGLVVIGISIGYFIGLPTTIHFLLHQFVANQVQPILTIQSYMSFVAMYMLGSALLFQIPLIMVFINRVKPLSPKTLRSMKYEKWVIILAFIFGGIMNPNPSLVDQAIIVLPLIFMYQIGIFLVWRAQHKKQRPQYLDGLLKKDNEVQSIRIERFKEAKQQWQNTIGASLVAEPLDEDNGVADSGSTLDGNTPDTQEPKTMVSPPPRLPTQQRPMKYLNGFRPSRDYGSITQRQIGSV